MTKPLRMFFQPEDWPNDKSEVVEEDKLWVLLNLYADGEATPEEAADVESRLAKDPDFARELAMLRFASQNVQTLPQVVPPAHLTSAILAQTSQRPVHISALTSAWAWFRYSLSPVGRYSLTLGTGAAAAVIAGLLWPHAPITSQPMVAELPVPSSPAVPTKTVTPVQTNRVQTAPQVKVVPAPQTGDSRQSKPMSSVARMDSSVNQLQTSLRNIKQKADKKQQAFAPDFDTQKKWGSERKSADTKLVAKLEPESPAQPEPYTVLPRMNDVNQRRNARTETIASGDAEKLNVETVGATLPTKPGTSTAETASANTIAAASEVVVTPTSTGKIRRVKIRLSQLPPDARRLMTPADIKRMRDEAISNDWDGTESVQGSRTSSLVFSRF